MRIFSARLRIGRTERKFWSRGLRRIGEVLWCFVDAKTSLVGLVFVIWRTEKSKACIFKKVRWR